MRIFLPASSIKFCLKEVVKTFKMNKANWRASIGKKVFSRSLVYPTEKITYILSTKICVNFNCTAGVKPFIIIQTVARLKYQGAILRDDTSNDATETFDFIFSILSPSFKFKIAIYHQKI